MSEDIGRRGLCVLVGWVENEQDWDDEEGAHGATEGAHTAKRAKKESVERDMGRWFMEFMEEHTLHVLGSIYRVVVQAICLAGMAVLLMMVSRLPAFGFTDNPTNNEVAGRHLEDELSETEAVNTVAGTTLSYQAFDISGESAVLFLSVVNVIALMRRKSGSGSGGRADQGRRRECEGGEERDIIPEQVARLLIPFTLISGSYVVFDGHLSPGGGFSGEMVMGAGLILYANAFGYQRIHHFFSFKTFTVASSGTLMVYAPSKGHSLFMGVNHLEPDIPLGKLGNALDAGLIPPLNVCVGLVVVGAVYCFYSLSRGGGV